MNPFSFRKLKKVTTNRLSIEFHFLRSLFEQLHNFSSILENNLDLCFRLNYYTLEILTYEDIYHW